MILSKGFILEVRSETLDGPFEVYLKNAEGVLICGSLDTTKTMEYHMGFMRSRINKILTEQGVGKLLDHYPAELIVKKYIGTTIPSISKFLITGLNVGMQI